MRLKEILGQTYIMIEQVVGGPHCWTDLRLCPSNMRFSLILTGFGFYFIKFVLSFGLPFLKLNSELNKIMNLKTSRICQREGPTSTKMNFQAVIEKFRLEPKELTYIKETYPSA